MKICSTRRCFPSRTGKLLGLSFSVFRQKGNSSLHIRALSSCLRVRDLLKNKLSQLNEMPMVFIIWESKALKPMIKMKLIEWKRVLKVKHSHKYFMDRQRLFSCLNVSTNPYFLRTKVYSLLSEVLTIPLIKTSTKIRVFPRNLLDRMKIKALLI